MSVILLNEKGGSLGRSRFGLFLSPTIIRVEPLKIMQVTKKLLLASQNRIVFIKNEGAPHRLVIHIELINR